MSRRVLATLALVAVCAAAVLLTAAGGGGGEGTRYRIIFDNAFGIVEGADFKVAGVRAGSVTRFDLAEGFPPRALVEVEVKEPGLRSLRADARCEVRPQSLIGEYFVDCQPGRSERQLRDGTVPVEQTAGTIPLDLVNTVLREPQRERLPLILNALGAGLAGRPDDVREVLARAHPGLRETEQTLEILGRQEATIERFVADADTVLAALERKKQDVRRFVREAGETAEVSATRRDELARTFDRLPVFLDELEPTMARLGELAEAQTPVLRDLRRSAPDLNRTLRELEPFSEASRPALAALGDLSRVGSRALRESDEEIRELRALARGAPGLAKPLRQFLQTLDDRDRSIEPDPRAALTAPPAPDKTADAAGKGFTGMEALLNYAFWQTLGINSFDEISHVLRFTVAINDCSPYNANPSPQLLEKCASWLGPYQPGINAPDPTAGFDRVPTARQAAPPPPQPVTPPLRDAGPLLDFLLRP